jgi:hypothetical protein
MKYIKEWLTGAAILCACAGVITLMYAIFWLATEHPTAAAWIFTPSAILFVPFVIGQIVEAVHDCDW